VREAAALVRARGPSALTSGNVAAALGVTQSAIYRHVRDMDELMVLTSEVIVGELTAVLEHVVADPDVDWDRDGSFRRVSDRLVTAMLDQTQAFVVVDRWRFEPGELGCGIRQTLATGKNVIRDLIENRWRADFGTDELLDDETRWIIDAHAALIQDEVIAIARIARRDGPPVDHDALVELLQFRLASSWLSLCLDLNGRLGLPDPPVAFP